MRVAGGLFMAREETGRRRRGVVDKRTLARRIDGLNGWGWGDFDNQPLHL